MAGLALSPLETSEAEPYWRTFLAGRTDRPTTDVRIHIDRYLALPGEEQRFGMHVGSETEWREYVTGIWKGDSGTYLPVASWAARDPEGVAGVALTTHWMGSPLLSELGVRKDVRGQGLGRALVVQTM